MRALPIKVIVTAFGIMFWGIYANGQVQTLRAKVPNSKQSYLRIGDKVPDIFFAVNNYKTRKVRISDFNSKLIILDLWGTYCVSCIEHMPEIEKLQRQFKDDIQILMVTKNSDEEVRKCAIRAENVKKNSLPFINGKESLAGYFNVAFVPQYVWIDDQGIIKNISEESDVTSKSIENFLKGIDPEIKIKQQIPNPNGIDPLLLQMYPYLKNDFYIYSYLTVLDLSKYTTGSSEVNGLNMKNRKWVSGNSFNFKSLYKLAYGYSDSKNPINDDRIIVNFKDTANYSSPTKQYVYEIIANKNLPVNRIIKHIQSEFDLFFNVKSCIERRAVSCLVIKRLNAGKTYQSTKADTGRYDKVDDVLKVTLPWGKFISWTNGLRFLPPHTIIDETGIPFNEVVDFEMNINFNNMEKIRKSLAPYGLTINEEIRQFDCIIINDL
jgi:thiol-disulfide isomerase/thioredoxin